MRRRNFSTWFLAGKKRQNDYGERRQNDGTYSLGECALLEKKKISFFFYTETRVYGIGLTASILHCQLETTT